MTVHAIMFLGLSLQDAFLVYSYTNYLANHYVITNLFWLCVIVYRLEMSDVNKQRD